MSVLPSEKKKTGKWREEAQLGEGGKPSFKMTFFLFAGAELTKCDVNSIYD